MKVLYCLPTQRFFLKEMGGSVSHAMGFIDGLSDNDVKSTLVSGLNASTYIKNSNVNFITIKHANIFFWWCSLLYRTFTSVRSFDRVVIRWRPIVPYLFFPVVLLSKNCWIELNGFTGLDSKFFIIRKFVQLSLWIASRYFNIIVVSDFSKKQLVSMFTKVKNVYVMPNGYDKGCYSQMVTIAEGLPSLIYFGANKSYYDWDILFEVASALKRENLIGGLHIWGFVAPNDKQINSVFFHGPFQKSELTKTLAEVSKPILVIHSSNNEIALSGSPMKLYEYCGLGLPIVASDSLTAQAIDFDAINFYKAGNRDSMRDVINKTVVNYDTELRRAKNNTLVAEKNFTWTSIVKKWVQAYE